MSRLSDNIRCDGSDVGRGCGRTGKDHPQSLPDDGLPTPCGDFSREFCVILTIDELGLEIDVGSWGCSEGNLAGTYNVRTCKHGAGKIDRVGIDHRGRVIATKKMLGVSERMFWELRNRGEIPHIKIGRLTRFAVSDLKQFLELKRLETEIDESNGIDEPPDEE